MLVHSGLRFLSITATADSYSAYLMKDGTCMQRWVTTSASPEHEIDSW